VNELSAAFTLLTSALILALPRRLAAIPLVLAAAYVTRGVALEVGPATFTVLRIVVAAGALRALVRSESIPNVMNAVDRWMVLWALWLFGSSAFHQPDAWVFRAGLICDQLGTYFLFRVFVLDGEDVVRIFKVVCVVLVPVAVSMLLEKADGHNLFAVLGGSSDVSIRDGHVRARGPFAHPILAGTAGAACLPMALFLWRRYRQHALIGMCAAGGMVVASSSSGPIMMSLVMLIGLLMWRMRESLGAIRWFVVAGLVALDLVMNDPVYFLMARIDITGGSKGWHRAQLIRSSIEHLDEWWLTGTDYTRHWMATGIPANDIHTDMTNQFLSMGVMGGLPLMFLFILTLIAAFRAVGCAFAQRDSASVKYRFLSWTLGTILFGHVVNFLSITYFDQSIIFFALILASIAGVQKRSQPIVSMTRSAQAHTYAPRVLS
jgi:hypothetical protein